MKHSAKSRMGRESGGCEGGEGGALSAAFGGQVAFLWRLGFGERHRAGGQSRRFEVAFAVLRGAGALCIAYLIQTYEKVHKTKMHSALPFFELIFAEGCALRICYRLQGVHFAKEKTPAAHFRACWRFKICMDYR